MKALIALLLFFALERFCHRQTHGFALCKIQPDPVDFPRCETPPGSNCADELRVILSQPFHFLDSGGECYVFLSSDKQYVLKFFKHHHMRSKRLEDHLLPKSLREKVQNGRIEKHSRLVTSCRLAYERFRQRTGLIYLQLNPTSYLHHTVKLFDPIGCVHQIKLDTQVFALQHYAQMAYPSLEMLIESDNLNVAKQCLHSYVQLIKDRCDAGLADIDTRKRNFGFINHEAIELDLGSFTLNESLKLPQKQNATLLHETRKLKQWLAKRHPELAFYLETLLENHLSENP